MHIRDGGAVTLDLILLCGKRRAPLPGDWAAILQAAEKEARALVARLGESRGCQDWRHADLEALASGCLLAAASPHWPAVQGAGAPATALEAMRAAVALADAIRCREA
ncbi:MAG: hypothetical protein HY320_09110 [Armatimonadetes bacterium]|nr:hypothetical protein [Armatimonadota bacterium]